MVPEATCKEYALAWIKEDIPSFDIGGFVVGHRHETASLFVKSNGVLAGVPFAQGQIEMQNKD